MKQAKKYKNRRLEQYSYKARIRMWIEQWEKQMEEKYGKDWKEQMPIVEDVISGCNF